MLIFDEVTEKVKCRNFSNTVYSCNVWWMWH